MSVEEVYQYTAIDPWFLVQIEELIKLEEQVVRGGMTGMNAEFMRTLKKKGFGDKRLGEAPRRLGE